MSDLRKAAELALKALEDGESFDYLDTVVAPVLRQALAQPKREWVGLTHDEVNSWNLPDSPTVFEFAQFIEAKLKEKNT